MAEVLATCTRMGVDLYRCYGMLDCPDLWRVVDRNSHILKGAQVSLAAHTTTLRDVLELSYVCVW